VQKKDVRVSPQKVERIPVSRRVDVFAIGEIDDTENPRRDPLQEQLQLVGGNLETGRVVRRGQEDDLRPIRDRAQHALQVVLQIIIERNRHDFSACQARQVGIDGEADVADQRLVPRRKIRVSHHPHQIRRACPDEH